MVKSILNLKDKLLQPKRSDKYNMWFFLDGWRLCEISIGNKKGTVRPLAGGSKKIYNLKLLKEELKETYWYAARCDASKVAHESGRKKRKLQWERIYS
tara:strand:- start:503 stop:796 length:294 start_codon:yes stop_codon:yes gene_type:complete